MTGKLTGIDQVRALRKLRTDPVSLLPETAVLYRPLHGVIWRDQLPARSTLSRFLAALTAEPIDALACSFSKV